MMSSVVVIAICTLFIGVFGPALLHKVRERPRFSAALHAYQILPSSMVTPVVWLLILAEIVVTVGLIITPELALRWALCLFAGYGVAIAINVARGRSEIDCGCGDEPTPVSWRVLLRNMVLVGLALIGIYLTGTNIYAPELSAGTVLLGISLGLTGWILYLGFEQLIANSGRHQRLWLGV